MIAVITYTFEDEPIRLFFDEQEFYQACAASVRGLEAKGIIHDVHVYKCVEIWTSKQWRAESAARARALHPANRGRSGRS